MTALKIAKNLSLPGDTITSTMIVYGGKGMGKTNLLSVLCEEMAKKRFKFSVLDPMGVCWGLQHGADKSGKGIDVLILGGIHGDIPIEPTAGAVVADLVVDETVSTVVDISRHANGKMWSRGERIRFVADYCTRLYERQGENRIPLLQLIDEAARFVPQHIPHGAVDIARCTGAIEQLGEEGRNIGVGLCLFAQRSARLNKSVAELADCMFSFRTVGPNSIKAILEWLGEHVDKSRWKDLLSKIRALPIGQALVVSPGWLQYEGIVQVRPRETFDSSATPKPGKPLRAPGKATKPDLKKYREKMKATIEKAQAEDPRVLKAKIAELQKMINAQPGKVIAGPVEVKTIEVPVLKDAQVKQLTKAAEKVQKMLDRWVVVSETTSQHIAKELGTIAHELFTVARAKGQPVSGTIVSRPIPSPPITGKTFKTAAQGTPGANGDLSAYALGLIQTMARRHPMKVTRGQLAVLAGRSLRSSAYAGAFAKILRAGMIVQDRQDRELFSLTESGMEIGGGVDLAPQSPQEKQETWRRALPHYERALFEVLLAFYPAGLTREELAQRAGKSITSSMFAGAVSSLRKNGIADIDGSSVTASNILFD
jgi:hypothetical protein